MRRENEKDTAALQVFGIKRFRRIYLPFWLWFIGWLVSVVFIIPIFFYLEIFAVEGIAV